MNGKPERTRVLLVDDDEAFRTRLARAFTDRGFAVESAGDAARARELARAFRPALAVVDLRLPEGSGLDVVRALRADDPAMRILILTGYGSIATAVEAMRLGADTYLSKPADADEILGALERARAAGGAPARDAAPEGSVGREPAGRSGTDPEEAEVPTLARVEWEHINRVLADCDGNISEAARRLGVHRRSLQRKLQKYPPRR